MRSCKRDGFVERRLIDINGCNGCTATGEFERCLATHAVASAGDDDDFLCDVHGGAFLPMQRVHLVRVLPKVHSLTWSSS